MLPVNLLSLTRPGTITYLDINGVQWELWLSQIRTDAIMSDVWQYIDPSIPDNQIPRLTPPPPATPATTDIVRIFAENDNDDNNNNNNNKAAVSWAVAALVQDCVREWKLYDEKMEALRVIRAFILCTTPAQWTMHWGVVGGGPFVDVRAFLASLSARVGVIRANRQRQQQRFSGGSGGGGNMAVAPEHFIPPLNGVWE
ncbi:hypothetical protein EYB26_006724 [Talaromyces marneffei]|uniref:uncharacterized protein n=1 Tax=Talaromyces marneffei TaxID=37727 RepID=UPI0012AAAD3C|nr:uncharacterized protein EYB26_006724 [Talaromyces marneffei]QGA19039.1 hypothetical protein EYB26_006724 [Talaromyces marneffei]